jgi:uncharacterized membrane protein YbhN (UPF0104 family)
VKDLLLVARSALIVGGIFIVAVVLIVAILFALGAANRDAFANTSLYAGLGIILYSFAAAPSRGRPEELVRMRFHGPSDQQRQLPISYRVALAGVLLSATGWFMLNLGFCEGIGPFCLGKRRWR